MTPPDYATPEQMLVWAKGVTEAGKDFIRATSPHPDARQRRKDRYSRFLDLSDVMPDLTFRDFLRREKELAR